MRRGLLCTGIGDLRIVTGSLRSNLTLNKCLEITKKCCKGDIEGGSV